MVSVTLPWFDKCERYYIKYLTCYSVLLQDTTWRDKRDRHWQTVTRCSWRRPVRAHTLKFMLWGAPSACLSSILQVWRAIIHAHQVPSGFFDLAVCPNQIIRRSIFLKQQWRPESLATWKLKQEEIGPCEGRPILLSSNRERRAAQENLLSELYDMPTFNACTDVTKASLKITSRSDAMMLALLQTEDIGTYRIVWRT